MALEANPRDIKIVAIVVPVLIVAAFVYFWRNPKAQEIANLHTEIDTLTRAVEAAREDLREGTVESLRERVGEYERSLDLMRTLVPTKTEVPALLDEIAARAGRRGVDIGQFTPLGAEPGAPFDQDRYQLTVFGRYDELGEFLADVGSLRRIMVPRQLSLALANQGAANAYGDTSGALLEATFQLRTFVKPPQSGAGGESQ